MKITIEKFQQGSGGGPSATSRYLVTYDQPPTSSNGFTRSLDTAWHTSLANAITFINGITERAGP